MRLFGWQQHDLDVGEVNDWVCTTVVDEQQNVAMLELHLTIQPLGPLFEEDGRHPGFLVGAVDHRESRLGDPMETTWILRLCNHGGLQLLAISRTRQQHRDPLFRRLDADNHRPVRERSKVEASLVGVVDAGELISFSYDGETLGPLGDNMFRHLGSFTAQSGKTNAKPLLPSLEPAVRCREVIMVKSCR